MVTCYIFIVATEFLHDGIGFIRVFVYYFDLAYEGQVDGSVLTQQINQAVTVFSVQHWLEHLTNIYTNTYGV